jgi:hypothetical protein
MAFNRRRDYVEFNDRCGETFAKVHEQLSSGKDLKDKKGDPVHVDLRQIEIPPGSFSFSIFDVTLKRQAYLIMQLLTHGTWKANHRCSLHELSVYYCERL